MHCPGLRNLGVVDLGERSWAHVSIHALPKPRCGEPGPKILGICTVLGTSVKFMLCRNLGVVNLGQKSWAYALSWAPESTSCSAET